MKLTMKESSTIKSTINNEREKVIFALTEITECMSLNLIDTKNYDSVKAHLNSKADRYATMYDAVSKCDRICNYIPVAGPMARKTQHATETISDGEKALILEAYDMAFPER